MMKDQYSKTLLKRMHEAIDEIDEQIGVLKRRLLDFEQHQLTQEEGGEG